LEKQKEAADGFLHIHNNKISKSSSENSHVEPCKLIRLEDSSLNFNHKYEKDLFSFNTNNNNNKNVNVDVNDENTFADDFIQNKSKDIQKLLINEKYETASDSNNRIKKAQLTSHSNLKKFLFPQNNNIDEFLLFSSKKEITEEILNNPNMETLLQLSMQKAEMEVAKNKIGNEFFSALITKPNPSRLKQILQYNNNSYIYNNSNYFDDNATKNYLPYLKINKDYSNNYSSNFNLHLLNEKNSIQDYSGNINIQHNDIKTGSYNNLFYNDCYINNNGNLASVYKRNILLNQYLQIKSLENQNGIMNKFY